MVVFANAHLLTSQDSISHKGQQELFSPIISILIIVIMVAYSLDDKLSVQSKILIQVVKSQGPSVLIFSYTTLPPP